MADNKMLSLQEKRKLASCFDLSLLSQDDREFFYSILYNHLDEFPILTMLAKDVMNGSKKKIEIHVKNLDAGINGYQRRGEICFSTQLWHSCKRKKDTKRAAATFWHELTHAIQEEKLNWAPSKRGYMVHRQFIEAEAMSYTNLISPRSSFEKKLYESILRKTSDVYEAQKKYLGVSTRLRLNADRELAKMDAQNIMGKYFSESAWEASEKTTIANWRDFYYNYHKDYAEKLWQTKGTQDNKFISDCEKYFLNRYDIKISAKASISPEVINNYGLSDGIRNTIVYRGHDSEVFDFSKWRKISDGVGGDVFTLDMPDMDPSYIAEMMDYVRFAGIDVEKIFIRHRDDFSSRALQIKNTPENLERFFEKCGVPSQKGSEKITWPNVNEKDCGYDRHITAGTTVAIDSKKPPVFYVGKKCDVQLDLKDILSKENQHFLKKGGILLIGRNPESLNAKRPQELNGYPCKNIKIATNEPSVSRIHGYVFMNKSGMLCYKDCSTYGTLVKRRKGHVNKLNYSYDPR